MGKGSAQAVRPAPVCPVCGKPAELTETPHGVRHDCCGLRSWNYQPLASRATLRARSFAHSAFDPLWKGPSRIMPRGLAYKRLAAELGMSRRDCHIAQMSEEQARLVPDAVKRIRERDTEIMAKRMSRPKRWAEACAKLSTAADELAAAFDQLDTSDEDMREIAVQAATDAQDALTELSELRDEYQDWRDGLPENLDSSVLAEKLDEVTCLDFDVSFDPDNLGDEDAVRELAEELSSLADEAEGMDLPLGFGRD